MLTIYDKEGNEKDWNWLVARFGDVTISQSQAEKAYRVTALRENEKILLLGTGERGIRFRPPLTVTDDELDRVVEAMARVLDVARPGILRDSA